MRKAEWQHLRCATKYAANEATISPAEFEVLSNLADVYEKLFGTPRCFELFDYLVDCYEEIYQDAKDAALLLMEKHANLLATTEELEDLSRAETLYRCCIDGYESLGDLLKRALLQHKLAKTLRQLRRYTIPHVQIEEVRDLYVTAESCFTDLDKKAQKIDVLLDHCRFAQAFCPAEGR